VDWPHITKDRPRALQSSFNVEPTRKSKNSWQRSTLTEAGKRRWKELRSIARDRRKWKELVDNLCSWWNNGLYYYYYSDENFPPHITNCASVLMTEAVRAFKTSVNYETTYNAQYPRRLPVTISPVPIRRQQHAEVIRQRRVASQKVTEC
jgi:hypothetical protein